MTFRNIHHYFHRQSKAIWGQIIWSHLCNHLWIFLNQSDLTFFLAVSRAWQALTKLKKSFGDSRVALFLAEKNPPWGIIAAQVIKSLSSWAQAWLASSGVSWRQMEVINASLNAWREILLRSQENLIFPESETNFVYSTSGGAFLLAKQELEGFSLGEAMNRTYSTLICHPSIMGDSSRTADCLAGLREGVAYGASETIDCSRPGSCGLGDWKSSESHLSSWLKDGLRSISQEKSTSKDQSEMC